MLVWPADEGTDARRAAFGDDMNNSERINQQLQTATTVMSLLHDEEIDDGVIAIGISSSDDEPGVQLMWNRFAELFRGQRLIADGQHVETKWNGARLHTVRDVPEATTEITIE